MDQLVINGNSRAAEVAEETAAIPSFALSAPPPATSFAAPPPPVQESNYILLQTTGPLRAAHKQALAQAEVELLSYKGNNIYLAGYKPKTLDPVTQGLDFVERAEVYHPAYVVQSGLKSGNQSEETTVNLSLHPDIVASGDPDAVASVQSEIASTLGVPVSEINISHGKARVTVPKSRLPDLAVIDAVENIHEYIEPTLNNHSAGVILKAHKPVGITNTTYKGKGQTVCVSDTGFDTGNKDQCHAAFGDRVKALYPLGRPDKTDDFNGHGTHVSGSVIGKGTYTSSVDGTSLEVESPASEANLVVQALASQWRPESILRFPRDPRRWQASLSGIPASLIDLFTPITTNHPECQIHTNSWGSKPPSEPAPYEESAKDIDTFAWRHKSFIPLFSAGNSGFNSDTNSQVPSSITSQGQAKNAISVGATQSFQPDLELLEQPDLSQPGTRIPNPFNNPEQLAYFSSRGPSGVNIPRVKPDIVAPGMNILSTRSSKIDPPKHYSEGWGISHDQTWQFNSGTSMATPLVAGCVAVIRGALIDNGVTDPSAALIKALLINGAVPLKGNIDGVPNFDSGFGRVNLENSLSNIVNNGLEAGFGDKRDETTEALGFNGVNPEEYIFNIHVHPSFKGRTLKVTLAYTDWPDEVLQNNINLEVARLSINDAGQEQEEEKRYGNLGEGIVGRDDVNNVEQVVWRDVDAGGIYRVTVRGYNIPFEVQPFAYAWRLFPAESGEA